MNNTCGLAFVGGLTYLVARIRGEWVVSRNQDIVPLDLPTSADLTEAIQTVERQLRAF